MSPFASTSIFLLLVVCLVSSVNGQAFSFTLPSAITFVNQMGMVGEMTGKLVIPQNGVNCDYKGYYNYLVDGENHLSHFYWETPCEFGTGHPTKQTAYLVYNSGMYSWAIDAHDPQKCVKGSSVPAPCYDAWKSDKPGSWLDTCDQDGATVVWAVTASEGNLMQNLVLNITLGGAQAQFSEMTIGRQHHQPAPKSFFTPPAICN